MGRNRRFSLSLCAAAACLLAAFGMSLLTGRYPLTPDDVVRALRGGEGMAAQVFWRLRLPRSAACLLAGMAMGLSGAVYQLVFANPLAAPDVMGVSGGATLGAALSIVFLGGRGESLCAFAAGMAALGASLLLTRAGG